MSEAMMPGRKAVNDDFQSLLARTLGCAIDRIRVVRHLDRPYSEVWFVHAKSQSGDLRIVAKSWSSTKAFEKQMHVLELAKEIYGGRKNVCIPYLGSSVEERLLFMQEVSDPTIEQLCRISPRRLLKNPNPLGWRRSLTTACRDAGLWLREWHEKTMERESLTPFFEAYMANRGNCMAMLGSRDQVELMALVRSVGADVICIPHGDFVPANIMWSSGKLTLLDFGVSEWTRMTPWWDCVAMEIGLFRALKFGARNLGVWAPALSFAAVNAFKEGYGVGKGAARVRQVCWAIRHLVLYAEDIRKGLRYRHRAGWHWREFQKALSAARAARHGMA